MTQIIKTALPLPAQVMVQFFKDKKNIGFEIDYEQSLTNLRSPKSIVQYLANLNLTQPSSFVTKKVSQDLLHSYIYMRDVCKVTQLADVHANVLYFLKYGDVLYDDALELFDYEDIVEFVRENYKALEIQSALLNSIPLFVATSHTSDVNADRSQHELVNVVDETIHSAISVSLFNLFSHKHFLIQYLEESISMEHQIYFKPHYEKPMYVGKTMFGWFATAQNSYFSFYRHINELAVDGPGRFELVDLYLNLIRGSDDTRAADLFEKKLAEVGNIKELISLTNKDVATINKRLRKQKKQAKANK